MYSLNRRIALTILVISVVLSSGGLLLQATLAKEVATSTAVTSSVISGVLDSDINSFLWRVSGTIREKIKLLTSTKEDELRIPILFGVALTDLDNNWGDSRYGGRIHEGIDIIADRGAFVVTPTDAVVTSVGSGGPGGKHVFTANPGGEQFYYAHLDRIASGIAPGKVLSPGDLVGYVGSSGNADHASPHLHFAIYYRGIARNPYARLVEEFSLEDRISTLANALDISATPISDALYVVDKHGVIITKAENEDIELPATIDFVMNNGELLTKSRLLASDMKLKAEGEGVKTLQALLIDGSSGSAATALRNVGATGYFGGLTENALAEYQKSVGISPARGYFGPITRARILNLLSSTESTTIASSQKSAVIPTNAPAISRDLTIDSQGNDVMRLQQFLISEATGPASHSLSQVGPTGYFGSLTENSLAEYQSSIGIAPARGYFGPITRAQLSAR